MLARILGSRIFTSSLRTLALPACCQRRDMRDQLESLQKRWNALRQERDQLRSGLDIIHQALSQLKVDYQTVMKNMTDLSSTEDSVLDNVKFLLDELTSLLKKHEVAA